MSLQLQAQAEIERRRREKAGICTASPYDNFRERYRDDPSGFVRDCVHFPKERLPYDYQIRVLDAIPHHRRISLRSPHGAGKSAVLSWIILWYALTRDGEDWKIPITASAWRQLSKFLAPEIHKWTRRLKWNVIGREPFNQRTELLSLNLKLATGEAFTMASDNSELIEGAHADNLLYIFDESKAIPEETWDSAEGAFSTGDAIWISASTPGEPAGRFYQIQSHAAGFEDWFTIHVTMDDCIRAGSMNAEWVENRRKQWGEDSAVFLNRVKGEFATSAEDGVIPLTWVEQANERYLDWRERGGTLPRFTAVGVDVGRGGDKSSMALRFEMILAELRRSGKADTMDLVGKVAGVLKKHHGKAIIDVIGIGAGVVDRLREKQSEKEDPIPADCQVIPFNAAEKVDWQDATGELGFVNARSAAWWNMRELLDPANQHDVLLPDDDLLIGDLTSPRWKVVSGGKIQIESKDDIRARLKRSTDDGDSVVMAFWEDRAVSWSNLSDLGHVEGYRSPWA